MVVNPNETSRRVAALRANLANGEHLDLETEIVPYVDRRLNGEAKRSVEAHVAHCDVCRREVDDLRTFAAGDRGARRRIVIAALAAAAVIAIGIAVMLLMRKPAPVQSVRVAPPPVTPTLTASLRDGDHVIGIDRSGALRGITLDAATAQRVASLLAHPELAAPSVLATLAAPSRELRGSVTDASAINVVSPAGIAIAGTRPQFMWSGPSNATYSITITDNDAFVMRGRTSDTSWTPPSDLARGRTYTWQVSTTIDGHRVIAPAPPAPPALFRVVDEKTALAIESAPSHLIAGMLAYDAGAIADARRHFEQLAAANPSSPIPPKLIASCDRALR